LTVSWSFFSLWFQSSLIRGIILLLVYIIFFLLKIHFFSRCVFQIVNWWFHILCCCKLILFFKLDLGILSQIWSHISFSQKKIFLFFICIYNLPCTDLIRAIFFLNFIWKIVSESLIRMVILAEIIVEITLVNLIQTHGLVSDVLKSPQIKVRLIWSGPILETKWVLFLKRTKFSVIVFLGKINLWLIYVIDRSSSFVRWVTFITLLTIYCWRLNFAFLIFTY
jgi:hypothetical protein